jgi:hypothetical protein
VRTPVLEREPDGADFDDWVTAEKLKVAHN